MTPVVQDTLSLNVSAEKTIVNDTVKLVATITAQVTPDEPPEVLPNRVREMMNRVVDTTKCEGKWNFSNMQRSKDDTGYERVSLTATARVPESENYNLDGRVEKASQRGLVINDIQADTSVPSFMIEDAVKELRVMLAKKAREECAALSEALDRPYRIQQISFGSSDYGGPKALRAMSASNAMGGSTQSYGTGAGDDGTLGNAQKVTLAANVTLAVIVDLPPTYHEAIWKPQN